VSYCDNPQVGVDGQLYCSDGSPYSSESSFIPLQQQDSGSFFGNIWDWTTGHIALILLALFLLIILYKNVFVVGQQTALIVERLGKYRTTMHAGLRTKIPFLDRVVDEITLQIQEIKVETDIKTSSNEFILLPVKVFVRVLKDKVDLAYYEVEKPKAAIASLVQNEVKSFAAGMSLQEIFDSRDTIKTAVQTALAERLADFGYEITEVVIDNPVVPESLQKAFNNVTAAQQEQQAATAQAEALRIKMVGEANAEAESLRIKAGAIVGYRDTLAEGNAEAIRKMIGDTGLRPETILDFLAITDTNDAVRDAAGKKGTTVVVATGNPRDGLYAGVPHS
jgi:regulator of protease activity HflC (stomatin/prohibitin superfamily)